MQFVKKIVPIIDKQADHKFPNTLLNKLCVCALLLIYTYM